MIDIIMLKDRLKSIYGKYNIFLLPAFKLVLTFLALVYINRSVGFMATLKNPLVCILISIVCSIMPYGAICFVLALVILAHVFLISVSMAVVLAMIFLVIAVLYCGFRPNDSILFIVTPILMAINIPYMIPILVGLSGSFVSVISISCGIVLYYFLYYIKQNTAALTNESLTDITQRFSDIINAILTNKTMILFIVAFALALIVVYVIRKLSINNAWMIAAGAGMVVMLITIAAGMFILSTSVDILFMILGIIVAIIATSIYGLFFYGVDYARTEFTQFEDDEYIYYVKAVPKISMATPQPKVKKYTHSRRLERELDDERITID